MFLRYYSWRGQCACTMYIPDRFGGWCNKETGAIASRDEACSKCRGMPDDMYADCDALPGGVSPRLIPDEELLCTDCKPACDGAVEEPQCSMATGQMVIVCVFVIRRLESSLIVHSSWPCCIVYEYGDRDRITFPPCSTRLPMPAPPNAP